MKRGYLLPEGCKDLMDVLKLRQHETNYSPLKRPLPLPSAPPSLPPIFGELVVPEKITVADLAGLLGQKPFVIITDLMRLGFFANVGQTLGFRIASSVARNYGFIAKRAG